MQVPSHLFEFFARDPSVIQAWARKYPETRAVQKSSDIPGGQPPPLELIKEEFSYRSDFAAIEIQNQLLYALVDQVIDLTSSILCNFSCFICAAIWPHLLSVHFWSENHARLPRTIWC